MFEHNQKTRQTLSKLAAFMDEHIYTNEQRFEHELESHGTEKRYAKLPVIDELKEKAKAAGLWNLFVPPEHAEYCDHDGFSFYEYAPIAELMGRVTWSAEVFNCSAPDTGNMEVLMNFGTDAQQEQWLKPLLAGEIRSSYAMTEPQVASSDATNIQLDIRREGDEWVLNGRKWFITGAMNERTKIFIVMGKTDPENANRHKQQSQVLVPKGTAGLNIIRPLVTMGYDDAPVGHAELEFKNVRVPLENMLLGEGRGFEIAQSRLGPGRMHHCMRLIGAAQRCLELACKRVNSRTTFGKPVAKHQSIRENIARSFSEIEMARLLVLRASWKIDQEGVPASIDMIAAAKTTVPLLVQNVIDRCMQMHGAGGLTNDYCMAEMFNYARWCRLADGPDEVHQMALGKQIINRYAE